MNRSRELRRRRQALLYLALFLVGALWSFGHEVAVQHAICPEHGEVVDVATSSVAAEDHDHGPSFVPGAGSGEAEEHGHCPALSFVRERSVHPEHVPGLRTSACLLAPAIPRPLGSSWQSFARFLLAPNHSPPS